MFFIVSRSDISAGNSLYLYRSIQLYHFVILMLFFPWYAVYWNKCCCCCCLCIRYNLPQDSTKDSHYRKDPYALDIFWKGWTTTRLPVYSRAKLLRFHNQTLLTSSLLFALFNVFTLSLVRSSAIEMRVPFRDFLLRIASISFSQERNLTKKTLSLFSEELASTDADAELFTWVGSTHGLGWVGLGWVEIFGFLVGWVGSWVRNGRNTEIKNLYMRWIHRSHQCSGHWWPRRK